VVAWVVCVMWRHNGESEFVLPENEVMEQNKKCGFIAIYCYLLLFGCGKINCEGWSGETSGDNHRSTL
jgi:hypothetical protein